MSLEKQILQQIEAQNVPQRPWWYFFMKNIAWAGLAVVGFGLGAIGWAMVFYAAERTHVLQALAGSLPAGGVFFFGMPLLWLCVSLGGIFWGVWSVFHTKRAYRWSVLWWGGLFLGSQVAGGLVLSRLPVPRFVERSVQRRFPRYQNAENLRKNLWQRPARGLHHGKVADILPQKLEIKKPSGESVFFTFSEQKSTEKDLEKGDHVVFRAERPRRRGPRGETQPESTSNMPPRILFLRKIENPSS